MARSWRVLVALLAALCGLAAAATAGVPAHAGTTPDFALALSAGPTFNPGSSGTFTATVTPLNGESGPISLVPVQGTAQVTPPSAVVQSPYAPVTFTISSSAKLAGGTSTVTVEGTDTNGNVHSASTSYTITSTPADFGLSVSPGSITVQQGGSGSATVSIAARNGFTADLQLAAAANPSSTQPVTPVATWSDSAPVVGVPSPYAPQVLTVTVPGKVSTGTYSVSIVGASYNAASTDQTLTLTVIVVSGPGSPDFAISLSSCPTFNPGASTQFTATLTPLNGEAAPVSVTPAQGEMQVSPPTAAVQPPYAPVTFTVSQSAKIGAITQTITVEAVDANGFAHSASTTCASTTTPADFVLSASPTALTISQGATAPATVSIVPSNQLSSDVELAAVPTTAATSAQPIGTWSNGTPVMDVAAPYPAQTLTITVPSKAAVGTYTLEVAATSDNAASTDRIAVFTITVTPGANGDYGLGLSAGPTFNPGALGTFTATISPLGGENVPITLIPEQGTTQITPAAVVLQPPYAPVTFTVSANAHIASGSYTATVVAFDGNGFVHTAATGYTLTSTPADFGLAASPATATIAQSASGSVSISVSSINGEAGDVQLTVAPAGASAGAIPVATWGNGTPATSVSSPYPVQALNFTVPSAVGTGTYNYTVTGASSNAASTTRTLNVTVSVTPGPAGDFSLSLSAGPTFNPGASGTFTATITPLSGESGPITLTPLQGVMQIMPAAVVVQPPYAPVTFTISASAHDGSCASCTATVYAVDTGGHFHPQSTIYNVTTTPADFALAASPTSTSIAQGQAGSIGVAVTPTNGESSDVQLSVAPAGDSTAAVEPTAAWSNGAAVTDVASPYPAQALTFTAPSGATVGTYHFVVRGVSSNAGSTTHSLDVYVSVTPGPTGDFTLSLSSGPTFNPGTSGAFTATITPLGGEASPITLTPEQGTAQITPASVVVQPPYAPVTFTVSANAHIGAGSYTATVVGADANAHSHTASTGYTLTATPADFTLSASPTSTTVMQGQTGAISVTVTPVNGESSDVQLAATPAGDSTNAVQPLATWSNGTPATTVSNPYPAPRLTFTVPGSAGVGTYHFVVRGTSSNAASVTQNLDVYVSVTPGPTGDFTLSLSGGPTFNPGTSGTFTATISPLGGESTPIALTPEQGEGQVSPATTVVQPPYAPVTFTISTNAHVPAGTYTVTVIGVDANGHVHTASTSYTLTSTPADFTLSANPATSTTTQGGTAATSVTISAVNGESSDVQLCAAPAGDSTSPVQPVAAWGNGSPCSDIAAPYPSQALTFTVPADAAVGTYHFVVRGVGSNAASTTQTLDVFLTVTPGSSGDYTLALSANPTFNPGTSATVTATIGGLGGESGPITLIPLQGEAQVSPGIVVAQPPYAPVTFTLAVNAHVPAGSYTFEVVAIDSGGHMHTASVTFALTATPADFALAAAPTTASAAQGQTGGLTVTVSALNGEASDVQLSVVPAGDSTAPILPLATWSNSAPVVDVASPYPAQTLVFTVPSATAVGTYHYVVRGSSTNAASTVKGLDVYVTVFAGSSGGDFGLSLSGGPTFNPGTTGTFTASISSLGGESGPITLIPIQGVSQVTPAEVMVQPPYAPTTFTLSANAHAPSGSNTVTVVAFDTSGHAHTQATTYTLTGSPADYAVSASPTTTSAAQGGAATVSVTVTAVNGETSDVQLVVVPATDSSSAPLPIATWSNGTPATDVASPYAAQTLTFQVPSATPTGTYHYVIHGACSNAASVSNGTDVYLSVTPGGSGGDFMLASSGTPTFNPGGSGAFSVAVTPIGVESGPITLTPLQGPATISPATAQVQPPYAPTTFTVSANAHVPPGSYSTTVVGTDTAGHIHTLPVTYTLTSTPADFTVAATPSSLTVAQGQAGQVGVAVTPSGGMTADVQLHATPAADSVFVTGPVAQWSNGTPTTTVSNPYPTQTLSFTAPATASPGTYHFTVTGTSTNAGGTTHTADVYVTITPSSGGHPDFTLSLSGGPTFNPGGSGTVTATVTPLNGENAVIHLIADQGVAQANPATIDVAPPYAPVTVTLSASAFAPAGTYSFAVTGVDGNGTAHRSAATSYTLTSTSTATSFSLAATPTSVTLPQGSSVSLQVTVTGSNGMTADVQLAATPSTSSASPGVPRGAWSNGTPATDVASPYAVQPLTFSTSPTSSPGTYSFTITGNSATANPMTQSLTVSVTVVAADFTMSAPSGPTFSAGGSGTFTVTVAGLNGETGPVTLVPDQGIATASPVEVSVPVPSTVIFGLSTAAVVPAGSYSEGITAVDQRGTEHRVTVTYTVTAPQGADYTLAATPLAVVVPRGGQASLAISITPVGALGGDVVLSALPVSSSVTPPGPTATWSNGTPVDDVGPPYPAQILTVAAPSVASPGFYKFTVDAANANSQTPTHSLTVVAIVQ